MDIKLIAKLLVRFGLADSGGLFEGRVAFGPARKAPFGPSGRSAAGFRRLRWRAQSRQKRRNRPVNPNRCQAAGVVVAPLPRGSLRSATRARANLSCV